MLYRIPKYYASARQIKGSGDDIAYRYWIWQTTFFWHLWGRSVDPRQASYMLLHTLISAEELGYFLFKRYMLRAGGFTESVNVGWGAS